MNLATQADVELVLQQPIAGAEAVAAVEFALLSASAAVRNYTRQLLHRVVGDVLTLDGRRGRLMFLPELPVIAVSTVVEDGETLVPGRDWELAEHGILVRHGRDWRPGYGNLRVTYTHGYDPIPDMITVVTARAASRLYQAGLRAAEAGGVFGVASKSLGDFSVSFVAEGNAEGAAGASGARLLLMSEKDMLNEYRI